MKTAGEAIELLIKTVPYPEHITNLEISGENTIRFTWRTSNRFRFDFKNMLIEEVDGCMLAGSNIAILLEKLLKDANKTKLFEDDVPEFDFKEFKKELERQEIRKCHSAPLDVSLWVRCVDNTKAPKLTDAFKLTNGKLYRLIRENDNLCYVINDAGQECGYHKKLFELIDLSEYPPAPERWVECNEGAYIGTKQGNNYPVFSSYSDRYIIKNDHGDSICVEKKYFNPL